MATQTRVRKVNRRKKSRLASSHRAAAPKAPALATARRLPKGELSSRELPLTGDDGEPKPEELAKEEALLKPHEAEAATSGVETDSEDQAAEPRGRERSSYDGDTAIKLYLREIGQVKLLTPK